MEAGKITAKIAGGAALFFSKFLDILVEEKRDDGANYHYTAENGERFPAGNNDGLNNVAGQKKSSPNAIFHRWRGKCD